MWEALLQWDRDTFIYLNNLGIESYDLFWSTVTHIRTWIPLFVLFGVLMYWKFPRREATFKVLTILVLLLFVLGITYLTKVGVGRLRPNNNEELNMLIRVLHTPTDYSFFSGHASSSFALTILIYLFLRRKLIWVTLFFIWPLLFAMSRIYVGVHYPLDIIVGALIGTSFGVIFYKMYNRFILPYSR